MSLLHRALIVAAFAFTSGLAFGQEPSQAPEPAGVYTHDGFYARLGLGIGYGFGKNEIDTAGSPSADISGIAGATEIALGGTIAPGLVIGGGHFGAFVPLPVYKSDPEDVKAGPLVFSTLGPFADYYFDPSSGAHVQAALAFASIQQQSGRDLDQAGNGIGFSALIGGGYEGFIAEQWSVGILGRVQYFRGKLKAEGSGIESTVSMWVPALLFGATYH